MIERHIDRPMPMPSAFVVKKALNSRPAFSGVDADTGITDLNQNLFRVVRPGSHQKFAASIVDESHGLNAVDE
jgi:hypothetical protein